MLSKTAKYGLRAVVFIAQRGRVEDSWVRIDEVAAALAVPRNYLSKVMHQLRRADVLVSLRGPGGGFRLAHAAESLMLGDVIGVLDHWEEGATPCLLRDGPCTPDAPCVAHEQWRGIADAAHSYLATTSVTEILDASSHPAAWI